MKKETKKILVINVLTWFFIWFVTFGIYNLVLVPRGFGEIQTPLFISLYFLFISALVIFYFRKQFFNYIKKFDFVPFVFLFVFFIFAYFAFQYGRALPSFSGGVVGEYFSFALLSNRFLLSKSFEILFQQTMIILIIGFFAESKISLKNTIGFFMIVFLFVHLLIIFLAGLKIGLFFSIFSIPAAIVFPILIKKVNYGFVYSYILHYLFYIVAGIVYWLIV